MEVLDSRRVPVKASDRAARPGRVPYYGATGQVGTIDEALFDEPLILLGEDGAPFFDPHKPKAYLIDGPAWVNNHAHVLRAGGDFDRRWIHHYLNGFDYRGYANGTTRLKLTQASMRRIPVPMPSRDEQRRIVEILEDHLSRLDAAEAALLAGGRKAHGLRLSLQRVAFGHEAQVVSLASVVDILNGQTPKGLLTQLSDVGDHGWVPYYKVADMNQSADGQAMPAARMFVDEMTAREMKLHVRPAGTVLLPKRGGAIGTNKKRILTGPAAYDLNIMGLWPHSNLTSSYLWHWLNSVDLGKIADGSNVPQINAPQIRGLRIPLPCTQVQERTCAYLDEQFGAIRHLEERIDACRRRSATLRRAVLAAAFSGRLTGHRTDDEIIEEVRTHS